MKLQNKGADMTNITRPAPNTVRSPPDCGPLLQDFDESMRVGVLTSEEGPRRPRGVCATLVTVATWQSGSSPPWPWTPFVSLEGYLHATGWYRHAGWGSSSVLDRGHSSDPSLNHLRSTTTFDSLAPIGHCTVPPNSGAQSSTAADEPRQMVDFSRLRGWELGVGLNRREW